MNEWKQLVGKIHRVYPVTNKRVFNVELYVKSNMIDLHTRGDRTNEERASQTATFLLTLMHTLMDSHAAITRLQYIAPEQEQCLARIMIARTK